MLTTRPCCVTARDGEPCDRDAASGDTLCEVHQLDAIEQMAEMARADEAARAFDEEVQGD